MKLKYLLTICCSCKSTTSTNLHEDPLGWVMCRIRREASETHRTLWFCPECHNHILEFLELTEKDLEKRGQWKQEEAVSLVCDICKHRTTHDEAPLIAKGQPVNGWTVTTPFGENMVFHTCKIECLTQLPSLMQK